MTSPGGATGLGRHFEKGKKKKKSLPLASVRLRASSPARPPARRPWQVRSAGRPPARRAGMQGRRGEGAAGRQAGMPRGAGCKEERLEGSAHGVQGCGVQGCGAGCKDGVQGCVQGAGLAARRWKQDGAGAVRSRSLTGRACLSVCLSVRPSQGLAAAAQAATTCSGASRRSRGPWMRTWLKVGACGAGIRAGPGRAGPGPSLQATCSGRSPWSVCEFLGRSQGTLGLGGLGSSPVSPSWGDRQKHRGCG